MKEIILQSNYPVWLALLRFYLFRSPETKSGIYDALNLRYKMRHAHLTPEELSKYEREYLLQNAPDLLKH